MNISTHLQHQGIITASQAQMLNASWSLQRDRSKSVSFGEFAQEKLPSAPIRPAMDKLEKERRTRASQPGLRQALRHVHERRAILFVGAGFSLNPPGMGATDGLTGEVIRKQLLEDLRSRLGDAGADCGADNLPLANVAQLYEHAFSASSLTAQLVALCKSHLPAGPLSQHTLLAQLGNCFSYIVTANWDRLIERAFEMRPGLSSHSLFVARRSSDIARWGTANTTLIKIHGDLDDDYSSFEVPPRLTERAIRNLERDEPLLYNLLETLFASHPVIAIGFRPDDHNFQRLLDFTTPPTDRDVPNPIYLVDPVQYTQVSATWRQCAHIQATAEEFLEDLQSYIDADGASAGVSYRETKKHGGRLTVWARSQCELARKLLDAFPSLQRVDVVQPTAGGRPDAESIKTAVARRAATVLKECVVPNSRVAFSCGSTLKALVEAAGPDWDMFADTRLMSAVIPAFESCNAVDPLALITLLARSLQTQNVDGRAYHLPVGFAEAVAPRPLRPLLGLSDTNPVVDLQQVVQKYVDDVAGSGVFVLGVGSIARPSAGFESYSRSCLRALRHQPAKTMENRLERYIQWLHIKAGYVGDLMYRPFKRLTAPLPAGKDAESIFMNAQHIIECTKEHDAPPHFAEFLARLLSHAHGVPIKSLVAATTDANRSVVLVASDLKKADAVKTLCLAGLGDALVVDAELARALLPKLS